MASLYITEFSAAGLTPQQEADPPPMAPPAFEQKLAIGASSVASTQFLPQTYMIRLHADAICSVAFGANPTATAASMRLNANESLFVRVVPGQKVAVITNT